MLRQLPKRVGIVMASTHAYCRDVVHGIAAVGAEAGWRWVLVQTDAMPTLVNPTSSSLDGLIGCLEGGSWIEDLTRAPVPVVDTSYVSSIGQAGRVTSNDVGVGRLAAAYLLSLGLPNYGYLGIIGRIESSQRQQGFKDTLTAAGLPCAVLLWPAANTASNELPKSEDALDRWLANLPKPVGVLACNDHVALQLLAACDRLHLAVPDSVAILGVGNDELICKLANPAVSSIALSTHRIGYEAARMLDRLMRNRVSDEVPLLIPPAGVVPRASTSRPAIVDQDVAAAVRYIAMHIRDNLQVADVLREVLVSRRSLDQRFLKALGRTPAQEIARAQVEIAKQALTETTSSMELVATMAGFKNAKQLGSSFRKLTGNTPTAYRQQNTRPTPE